MAYTLQSWVVPSLFVEFKGFVQQFMVGAMALLLKQGRVKLMNLR